MRNPERIDNFLRLLGEEWKKQGTDLRFTQFMFNSGFDINNDLNGSLYYWEEDEILQFFPDINPIEYLYWGTQGKDGKQPLTFVLIKDLATDHLRAILANVSQIGDLHKETIINELKQRENGKITTGI